MQDKHLKSDTHCQRDAENSDQMKNEENIGTNSRFCQIMIEKT